MEVTKVPKKDYSDICLQGAHFIKQNEERACMMYTVFFSPVWWP